MGTCLCDPGAAFTETCCPASGRGNSSCSPVCVWKDECGRQGSVCSGLADGALQAKQDWESSLHMHRPGKPAANTLAVAHRPGGCEGLSRVHTMVSAGCD